MFSSCRICLLIYNPGLRSDAFKYIHIFNSYNKNMGNLSFLGNLRDRIHPLLSYICIKIISTKGGCVYD